MNAVSRELEELLHAAATGAAEIGKRLAARDDWQYPYAVALRAHAVEYETRLSYYLRGGRAEQLAWRLSYAATLCTRELAPLEPILTCAATLAWQLRAGAQRGARTSGRRRSTGADRRRALQALFATG